MEKRIEKLIEIMKEQEIGKKVSFTHFGVNQDLELRMKKLENKLIVNVVSMNERLPKIEEVIITDMDVAVNVFMMIHQNA